MDLTIKKGIEVKNDGWLMITIGLWARPFFSIAVFIKSATIGDDRARKNTNERHFKAMRYGE